MSVLKSGIRVAEKIAESLQGVPVVKKLDLKEINPIDTLEASLEAIPKQEPDGLKSLEALLEDVAPQTGPKLPATPNIDAALDESGDSPFLIGNPPDEVDEGIDVLAQSDVDDLELEIVKMELGKNANNSVILSDQEVNDIATQLHVGLITEDEAIKAIEKKAAIKLGELDDDTLDSFDLDKEIISVDNQNSPERFQQILDDIAFKDDQEPILRQLNVRDEADEQTLGLAMHIRGTGMIDRMDRIFDQSYSSDITPLRAEYPPREVAEATHPVEAIAINLYTKNGDEAINTALREKAVEPGSDLSATIQSLQNGLDKLPSWEPETGVLYRQVGDPNVRELYEAMPVGQVFTERAFTSTSRTALDFDMPGRNLNFVIMAKENGNGKPIEGFSEFTDEREILFKHGTEFKIVSKQVKKEVDDFGRTTTDRLIIFLEEL